MFSEDKQVSKFYSVKGCRDQPSVLEILATFPLLWTNIKCCFRCHTGNRM